MGRRAQLSTLIVIGIFLLCLSSVSAQGMTWNISTPSNYTYNSSLINVSNGAQLIGSSLVPYAWWHLNEVSGTNIFDSSGNGRNGTTVGSPSWVTAKLSNGLNLTGTQYGNMGDVASFERTNPFSVELWVKTTSSSGTLISRRENSGNYRGWDITYTGGNVYFYFASTTVSNMISVRTTFALDNNAWHHIIITYDGSSNANGVNIYIDGSLKTPTIQYNTLSATTITSTNLHLGARAGANQENGLYDEIVIYNKTLVLSEVVTRYNSGNGTETALFGSYPITNPSIFPITPFSFINPIQTVSETATKPSGTGIRYHSSFDNGSVWKYWNGASWVTTDDSYTQANTISELSSNIGTLNYSGLFKFRALLNSDGVLTPLLSSFFVSDTLTYPIISGVTASPINSNNATISWTTDLSSDSLVKYGLISNNLNLTKSSGVLVTSHVIDLTGLQASTLYFYNVTSCVGIACNVSSIRNFTTIAPPPSPNVTINYLYPTSYEERKIYNQKSILNLKVFCFDNADNYCPDSTICKITIFNPDTSVLINNQQMTYGGSYFYYPLNQTQTNDLGTYSVSVVCTSINSGYTTFDYTLTPTGKQFSLADVFVYVFFLLVCLTITFFSIRLISSNSVGKDEMSSNALYEMKKQHEFKYYLSILKKKMWIVGVFGVYLSLLLFLSLLNQLVFSLGFDELNSILNTTIIILGWGLIPFILFWIGYIIIYLYKSTEEIMRHQFGGFRR